MTIGLKGGVKELVNLNHKCKGYTSRLPEITY
jgi:hypothetical protein